MRVPLVLLIAFVPCAATAGCGTTHTLKNSSSASIAPLPAAPAGPLPSALPPASGTLHSDSVGRRSAPDPRPAQVAAPAKRRATMSDRMSSGMRTGGDVATAGALDSNGDGRADTTTIYVNGHVVRQEDVDAKKAGTGS